jgi:hypothetical protein
MRSFQLSRFIILFLYCFQAAAALASDFHSPRTAALGGAGHASPLLGDAIYLNPSFTSFTQTHSLSINYLRFSGNTINTADGPVDYYGNNLNISVVDGTSESLFQAGVGYTRRDDGTLLHIGASKSFVKKLGVGIGGKYVFPKDTYDRFTDANMSVTGLLTSWFQTSIIVDNLFEAAPSRGFYREFIIGTKFNFNPFFLVYVDPHWVPNLPAPASTLGYEAGLEMPFFKDFFVRIGKFQNSTVPYQAQRGDGFGLGGGWVGPKLSLDYAYSRVLSPLSSFSHNFGLSIYF